MSVNKIQIQGFCLWCSFPVVLCLLMVIIAMYGIFVFAVCFLLFGTILVILAGEISEISREAKLNKGGDAKR